MRRSFGVAVLVSGSGEKRDLPHITDGQARVRSPAVRY